MLRDPRSAYVIYGIEPGLDFADQAGALKALKPAQVVAFSQFACQSTRAVADVILPIGALPEIEATLTNLDGRTQRAVAAGKLPGEARPGWRVLRALGAELQVPGFEFTDLEGLRAGILPVDPSSLGSKISAADVGPSKSRSAEAAFEVAVSQAVYRTDGVVRRAAALQAHPLNAGPRATLHPSEAARLGLADGAMAKLENGAGTATIQLSVSDRVAPGCVWIESGYGATAPLAAGTHVTIRTDGGAA
jgi:NADH-quinone oxidoreductase subunit G